MYLLSYCVYVCTYDVHAHDVLMHALLLQLLLHKAAKADT